MVAFLFLRGFKSEKVQSEHQNQSIHNSLLFLTGFKSGKVQIEHQDKSLLFLRGDIERFLRLHTLGSIAIYDS